MNVVRVKHGAHASTSKAEQADQAMSSPDTPTKLGPSVELSHVSPDDFSRIRYVHESSVRFLAGEYLSEDQLAEWSRYVRSPAYTERFFANPILGAWVCGELIATASWYPSDGKAHTAHIASLYVSPLYANAGVGARLLEAIEAQAQAAGFRIYCIRTLQTATGFFQHHGYRVTAHGIRVVSDTLKIPVTFLRKSSNHDTYQQKTTDNAIAPR